MNKQTNAIKTNEFGAIDLAYYQRQAERARAVFIKQGIKAIASWLKGLIHIERRTPFEFHLGR
ncbi:MAG: hypothetical protein V7629_06220 [Motiliproteus sp.]